MNKKILFSLLTVMLLAVSFVSCSSDDDKSGDSNSPSGVLVGTWRHNYSATDYYTYTFNSNGTGYFSRPSWDVVENYTYKVVKYDAKSGVGQVTVVEADGSSNTKPFTKMNDNTIVYEGNALQKQ